jgi:hypothetical protein
MLCQGDAPYWMPNGADTLQELQVLGLATPNKNPARLIQEGVYVGSFGIATLTSDGQRLIVQGIAIAQALERELITRYGEALLDGLCGMVMDPVWNQPMILDESDHPLAQSPG